VKEELDDMTMTEFMGWRRGYARIKLQYRRHC
jgi:hypothetical protein